jgi:voltage-gated potassium channel
MTTENSGEGRVPRSVEIVMLILSVAMLPLVLLEESSSDPVVQNTAEMISAGIWFAFVGEYLFSFVRSGGTRRFIRTHWFDLLIIVLTPPLVWLPTELNALRALRAVRLLRALAVVGRTQHTIRRYLKRGSLPYLGILSVFVVIIGGLAIHTIEPETADSVGDGLWWAAATLSTVGYGDIAPTTLMGRIVAVILMVVGVGTFAGLTAAIAAYFVEDDATSRATEVSELRSELQQIHDQLTLIRISLAGTSENAHPLSTQTDSTS